MREGGREKREGQVPQRGGRRCGEQWGQGRNWRAREGEGGGKNLRGASQPRGGGKRLRESGLRTDRPGKDWWGAPVAIAPQESPGRPRCPWGRPAPRAPEAPQTLRVSAAANNATLFGENITAHPGVILALAEPQVLLPARPADPLGGGGGGGAGPGAVLRPAPDSGRAAGDRSSSAATSGPCGGMRAAAGTPGLGSRGPPGCLCSDEEKKRKSLTERRGGGGSKSDTDTLGIKSLKNAWWATSNSRL